MDEHSIIFLELYYFFEKKYNILESIQNKLKEAEYHIGQQNCSDHTGFLHLCSLEIICLTIQKV